MSKERENSKLKIISLDELKDKHIGKVGTQERDEYEKNLIKELSFKLRKETGAGVMDCKKALVRFDYDYDKALGWLKLGGHLKYTI